MSKSTKEHFICDRLIKARDVNFGLRVSFLQLLLCDNFKLLPDKIKLSKSLQTLLLIFMFYNNSTLSLEVSLGIEEVFYFKSIDTCILNYDLKVVNIYKIWYFRDDQFG